MNKDQSFLDRKKRYNKIMYTLFLILSMGIFITIGLYSSFKVDKTPKHKTLCVRYGTISNRVECDSFKMITDKEYEFWNDGIKNIIKSNDAIYPVK